MTLPSKNIKSEFTPLDKVDWQYIKNEMPSSTIVCWLFDRLIWGVIDANGNISYSDQNFNGPDTADIMELRVFNENKEIYLRRSGDTFLGRMRTDSQGNNCQVVNTNNYLWGSTGKINSEYTFLSEDNGMQLNIPGNYPGVSPENRVNLIIRNYIDYNERHMAGYVDARFVKLEMQKS
jgi:CRISPR-associated protein (TIGR03984 family)